MVVLSEPHVRGVLRGALQHRDAVPDLFQYVGAARRELVGRKDVGEERALRPQVERRRGSEGERGAHEHESGPDSAHTLTPSHER